ncbi:hypothetical protein QM3_0885 [Clostridioides difficile DA00215]|nr:hypothetical protein QM3_0885 [Clostridioides difficile DA00215]EQI60651.1 hypothetical protein QQ3_0956 [Clostridioides difficile Y266]EQI60756.1 hypothetical protein QQ3_0951 [Clostridioides difficile Y266]EQI63003.1 hypothetical protein QQ3_3826 [Clostridioides difficile Y266]EQI63008.1 hypothetical protein QQ3_3831 [Clostridioides difficile Y266]
MAVISFKSVDNIPKLIAKYIVNWYIKEPTIIAVVSLIKVNFLNSVIPIMIEAIPRTKVPIPIFTSENPKNEP